MELHIIYLDDNRVDLTSARGVGSRGLPMLIFLLITFVSQVTAQNKDDVIRIETDLVAVEVSVSDRDGSPVRGLSRDDFRIFENGVERKIEFFEPIRKQNKNRPLSVVFALDVSGSITESELGQLQIALRSFVARLADYQSNFAVISFGMKVKTLQSFTNQPAKLEKAFQRLLTDQDGLSTHAYDATDLAVEMLAKKSPKRIGDQFPRRVVILVTDGFPVGDIVSPKTVIERANEAETTIYSVIIPSYSRLQGTRKPLPTLLDASGLIELTGGKSLYVNAGNFEPLFKSLEEEITSSYLLAFYPESGSENKGRSHVVRVESAGKFLIRQNRTGFQLR